jgi:hypothetical protein
MSGRSAGFFIQQRFKRAQCCSTISLSRLGHLPSITTCLRSSRSLK